MNATFDLRFTQRVFSRGGRFLRCGKLSNWAVPHLDHATAPTPPKTSIISSLPHLARWGGAKFGIDSCPTATPASPPLGGAVCGGALSTSREVPLHPQCRLNPFGYCARSVGRTLGARPQENADADSNLGAVWP